MNLKKEAIKGTKWTSILTVVNTGMQFLQLFLLSKILGPEIYGIVSMMLVIVGALQILVDMGISSAIVYYQNISEKELSSIYWLNIIWGGIIYSIVYLMASTLATFFNIDELESLIKFVALIFIIIPFGQQYKILFEKELKFKILAKIEIFSSIINSVIAIVLAVKGFGAFSVAIGYLIQYSVCSMLYVFFGKDYWKPKIYLNIIDVKKYIVFGLYQLGERIINYFNQNLDYILIGKLLGPNSLGYYTLAYNIISQPITKINPIITRVAFPYFSKLQNNISELKKNYLQLIKLLSFVNVPLLIGLFILSDSFIIYFFGDKWEQSIDIIKILVIVGILRSIINPVGALMLSQGKVNLNFSWNLIAFFIQIPILIIGAKVGSAEGIAYSMVFIMFIHFVGTYYMLIKNAIGSIFIQYFKAFLPAILISTLMAIILSGFKKIFISTNSLSSLIILVSCGGTIYMFVILLTYFSIIKEKYIIFMKKRYSNT